ncbi:U4/U6.U5 snRNP associated protein [Rhizina undulata]
MPVDEKKNVYGTEGDTSFRRTWNRDEWAAKAKEREFKERAEGKLRAEAKAQGKKFYREPTPPDAALIEARRERINLEENLNKTTLVPAGAGVGKRGKGAGYYCEHCDLTFKDSLQWVDHLNSKQHLHATGQTAEVERATLEMVKRRLAWLKEKKRERERGEDFDLQKRLAERARVEEQERIEKRERRKLKKKEKKEVKKEADGDLEMAEAGEVDSDEEAMRRMMGFAGGFGSTKKN